LLTCRDYNFAMTYSRYLDISRDLEILLEIVRKHEKTDARSALPARNRDSAHATRRQAADPSLSQAS